MDTVRKSLTVEERQLLRDSLLAWRDKKVSWLMDTYGDIDHGILMLGQLSDGGHVVKFYEDGIFQGILAFDVGTTWWTRERICSELFVLAAPGIHGLQRAAITALEDIARDYGARLIVTGNIFQANNALIGNGYRKHGYRQECSNYVKEVTT